MLSEGTHQEISLTGKIGLTSNLTLDATYNPDFSQVETDAGQIDVNLRYGTVYEKLGLNGREYVPANDYLQTRRSFFFKASYLWRL